MDKRKVIILAIVLFLFIGLGTFVFAGGSEENENGQGNNTIETPDNNGGSGQDTPSGTEDDGETTGEGGQTTGNNGGNTTTAGGTNNEPGTPVQPGTPAEEPTTPSEPVEDNTKAELLAALQAIQEKIDTASDKDDIDSARTDRTEALVNAVEELNDSELNELLNEINEVLDDTTNPVLLVNGEEVENGTTIYVNEDATMTVNEDNLLTFTSNGADRTDNVLAGSWTAQGESTYNIVVTDKAFNQTTYTVVVDKTPIAVNHLYVLNNSHNTYDVDDSVRYKVIGNGQDLYVEYVLKEEFTSTPVIEIGGKEFEMTCNTASWDDSLYKCDAHITITDDMNLTNGEVIPFTITGVKDLAGNETVVTQDNVTITNKYGQVIYDNVAPVYNSLGLVNITHYREDSKGDNLFVANVGDVLRVMVRFDELLEVNPTVTLGGVTKEMHLDKAWADYSYWADIEITEDMDLSDGNIDFVISGYADAAGNVGEDLTSADIKNSTYTGVEFDTTAPSVRYPGQSSKVDHNDEYVTITVTEANGLSEVYYKWANINSYQNATNLVPEENITDNGDGTYSVKIPTVNGRNKLHIRALDNAGNEYKGYSSGQNYEFDLVAPEAEVSYNPESEFVQSVIVTITANEKITIDDTWTKVSDTVYTKEYTENVSEELVTITDLAGNTSEVTVTITNIDRTAPSVKYPGQSSKVDYNDKYVTITITEAHGLAKVYYKWANINSYQNATNLVPEENITNNGDGTYSVKIPTVNGRNKLHIRAIDNAGNEYKGYSSNQNYKFDLVAPEATVSYSPDMNTFTNQSVTVTITANEKITIDDTWTKVSDTEYTKEYTENVSEELVTITDSAGNTSAVTVTITNIDKTAPVIEGVESNKTYIGSFDFKITELNDYTITYGTGTSCGDITGTTYNPNDADYANLKNGIKWTTPLDKISICVTDAAGNSAFVGNISLKENTSQNVVSAMEQGGEVVLSEDITIDTSVGIVNGKELTVDLNGNDIEFAANKSFTVSGGTLNITGEGTIKESAPYFAPVLIKRNMTQGGNLTVNIGEDVTLEGWSGIFIDDNTAHKSMNTTVNFAGTINSVKDTTGAAGHGIYVNGNLKDTTNYPTINIMDGSSITSLGDGLYAAGYAEWNIYGGTIEAPGMAIGIKWY